MKSQFKEISTDYVDDNEVTHIDGYKTDDENDEGTVIGYFIKGEVYWRDPEYQFDHYVMDVVKELIQEYNHNNQDEYEVSIKAKIMVMANDLEGAKDLVRDMDVDFNDLQVVTIF